MAAAMYKASADDRGTVQALAQELDEAQETGGVSFKLSDRGETGLIPSSLYFEVFRHFQERLAPGTIYSYIALPPSPQSQPLLCRATFFDHVIVDHNQFAASRRSGSTADSLVGVNINEVLQVGELLDIFVINQPVTGLHHFGHMRWMVPSEISLVNTIWDSL